MAVSTDGYATTLRVIDFLEIPPEYGDAVVLIVMHPGLNLLGRYLPASKVNDLLLADISRASTTAPQPDVYMRGVDEPEWNDASGAFDIMDLASFLE
jgi:hypothetical protein